MSNILETIDVIDHAIRRAVFAVLDGPVAEHRANHKGSERLTVDADQQRGLAPGPDGNRSDADGESSMNGIRVRTALAALFGVAAFAAPILAQNEQFIPNLVYRTSAYAPNGTLGCRSDTDPGPTSTQGQTQYIVANRVIV